MFKWFWTISSLGVPVSTRSTRASGSCWRVLLFPDFFDFLSRLPYTERLLAGCITVWKGRNQFTSSNKMKIKGNLSFRTLKSRKDLKLRCILCLWTRRFCAGLFIFKRRGIYSSLKIISLLRARLLQAIGFQKALISRGGSALQKRSPFEIRFIDKWYPLNILRLELCTSLNCYKCLVF